MFYFRIAKLTNSELFEIEVKNKTAILICEPSIVWTYLKYDLNVGPKCPSKNSAGNLLRH